LFPLQLKRLAKRVALGLGRTGGVSTDSSGDLFIAFSTAAPKFVDGREHWITLANAQLDPLLAATVQVTEEAIVNALVAADYALLSDCHTGALVAPDGSVLLAWAEGTGRILIEATTLRDSRWAAVAAVVAGAVTKAGLRSALEASSEALAAVILPLLLHHVALLANAPPEGGGTLPCLLSRVKEQGISPCIKGKVFGVKFLSGWEPGNN